MAASARTSISVVSMAGDGDYPAMPPPPVDVRASTLKAGGAPRLPKPRDPRELEKRFLKVLVSWDRNKSMFLKGDKMKKIK